MVARILLLSSFFVAFSAPALAQDWEGPVTTDSESQEAYELYELEQQAVPQPPPRERLPARRAIDSSVEEELEAAERVAFPGLRIFGGGMVGLMGLGLLSLDIYLAGEGAVDIRGFLGIALLAGLVALGGLGLFIDGIHALRGHRRLSQMARIARGELLHW